jgi:hypothetical protein
MSFWKNKKKAKRCHHGAVPPRIIVVIVGEEGIGIEHLRHVIVDEEGAGIEHMRTALMTTSHCQPSRTLRHWHRPPRARGGALLHAPYTWPRGGEADTKVPTDPLKLL